jgi:signal transduction histidine kinase/ligand-binding sensor domain-containing protein/DNA-binding response OmpR family regulator
LVQQSVSGKNRKANLSPGILQGFLFFTGLMAIICLMLTQRAFASPLYNVDKIGLKDGLSNSEIRCIFQDRKGFLWFGTYNGLNRYDGYDFRVYRNQPEDTSSIIHSYVNCIAEDSLNQLWVGTRQGISVLNPLTEQFAAAYVIRPGGMQIRITNYIHDIRIDKQGQMYAATLNSGLIVFDKGSKVGHCIPWNNKGVIRYDYSVNALLILPDGKTYLIIAGNGLYEYDPAKKRLQAINSSVVSGTCLYPDYQNLWIGTTMGLYHFNTQANGYDKVFNESTSGFRSNRVTCLGQMPDGSLWVGTDGGGIQILDKSRTHVSYLSAGYNEQALSSDAVYSMLLDRDGRKWIGTLRGGINVIDDVKSQFQNIRHDPLNSNSLISNFVKSVFEDRDQKIWIGTDGGGLSIWDRKEGRFTNFRRDTRLPGTISSNFVTGIMQDATGRMWIATYGGGIDLYKPDEKQFKTYFGHGANGKNALTFWCFCLDHNGNIWASGLQDGLYLYDQHSDSFLLYDASLSNILALRQDKSGNLWAGNFDGIYRIDAERKKFQYYRIGKPVRSIHLCANGDLWLGTEGGLMYFARSEGKVTRKYTTRTGLCDNNILSIEEDQTHKLWLSTYNGLSRFDPRDQSFTNFFTSDGLASREFNFNASAVLKSGELAFGGTGGLTIFAPQQLGALRNDPDIALTDLKINGKEPNPKDGYMVADNHDQLTSLIVPFTKASFSFRFAAIEFTAQERIRYRYMLQCWDRDWIDAGNQRNVLYTRLDPGSYTLRINCTNPDGKWVSKELTLRIVVLPPWYRTIWAYLAYVLILTGLLYWFFRNKFRENRLKYEVKLANANAEFQRNLQEKEKELNERRIDFFTGVSHEFRTPLSLIINPVKDLLSNSSGQDRKDLDIVYRNSKRLLSLVDQLLLFRKADAVGDNLQIAALNIVAVCREVYLCFVQQAKLNDICFELKVPEDPTVIYGDREKIEIILFNLISNAIKYTPKGQKVTVRLSEFANNIAIEVADSGPGIPANAGSSIFEKFYRSGKQGQQSGFGIGLYLAKQFTDQHQGRLTFKSSYGHGTVFSLELPKGVQHFGAIEIADMPDSKSALLAELAGDKTDNQDATTTDEAVYQVQGIFTDKKTILVIDDDGQIRKYIKSVLESIYVIYEAENAEAGLEIARKKQPDMIVCDVMMPGMNGIELCSIIKQDQQLSYIPMILLTASAGLENKIKGLESGADDYIQKPFEKDILIARIANLLQTRSNLQDYFFNTITLKSPDIAISDEYKLFLEKCIHIVERHITDENFSIKVLAAEIGMSHSNLYRKVKSLSGHTVNGFIRYIRLRKAAQLLIESDMNVNEVALETGFNSIKYFRTQFFNLFGVNPSDFLKQKRPIFKKRFNIID